MGPATEHPLRYALVNELHARPSPRLKAPSTSVFVAFKEPRDAASRDHHRDMAHLSELVDRHGGPRPDPDDSHYQGKLGRYDLKWESHTEFVTYMATTPGLPIRPFDPSAAAIFPEEWQLTAPGKRVAAVMVQIDTLPAHPKEALNRIADWFAKDSLTCVWVLEETALIAGDFRIDSDGWMRFAIFVRPDVGDGRIGRIVHRLVELETYRAMSMLGLGRARGLSRRMNELEPRLSLPGEPCRTDTDPVAHRGLGSFDEVQDRRIRINDDGAPCAVGKRVHDFLSPQVRRYASLGDGRDWIGLGCDRTVEGRQGWKCRCRDARRWGKFGGRPRAGGEARRRGERDEGTTGEHGMIL